ncbi:hypothetical protein ACS3UN_10300 [Oscillospiraceae bacterium LTW-04]|nr:hypothetical protein RBH76_12050 [Oscillospiraceae bacterium MB24-C1]
MTYMKNGGLIRIVNDRDVARFVEMGYVPMAKSEKPARKAARKHKEEKPHGGA